MTVAEETLIPLTIRTRLSLAYLWDCSKDCQYSYFGLDHRACCHFYLTALMEGWGSRMREPLTQVMGLVCSSLRTNWRWCGLSCWLTLLSLWRQDDQELWIQTRNKLIDLKNLATGDSVWEESLTNWRLVLSCICPLIVSFCGITSRKRLVPQSTLTMLWRNFSSVRQTHKKGVNLFFHSWTEVDFA